MEYLWSLLQNWVSSEPAASLWMGVAALILFGAAFARLKETHPWGWSLLMALSRVLAFVALLGGSYFLLNSGFKAFSQVYGPFVVGGSLSNRTWQQWQQMYGGAFTLTDLQVTQYTSVEMEEMLQSPDPASLPLFRRYTVEQPVAQNSISGFHGLVDINVNGAHGNKESFNGYSLAADLEYEIVNKSPDETRAEFRLPVSPETKLYQNVHVSIDGTEKPWLMRDNAIFWEKRLAAGEQATIAIHFEAWGENSFVFTVPEPREITNFSLRVILDTDNC
jgi:hypothetical protein